MSVDKIIKIITGKEIKVDQSIPLLYIINRGIYYFLGLIRGSFKSFNINKRLFIGKKTTIRCKKQLILGHNVNIGDYVAIDALSSKGVILGDNVKIGNHSIIGASGSISTLGKGMKIGKNSSFGDYTLFGAAGGLSIGENVISGPFVRFHAENHNFDRTDIFIREQGINWQGIEIGNDCWIGAGSVFLDGSAVGDGCVVAANSVVTKKFPNNVVIAGVPAKIIRKR